MLCAHNKTWLKLLPLPTDTTQFGLVVPLSHPFLLSRLNGSPRRSTKRTVPRLSTESACDHLTFLRRINP